MGSPLTFTPLDATLGAIVTGTRIPDLDAAGWQLVDAALLTYALLIFPHQHLSDDEQRAFGRRFGELDPRLELAPISNVDADGTPREPDGVVMQSIRGNEGWHTDSSYMPAGSKVSILSAHVMPRAGGQTEWADMRAAYDALDDATRRRLDGLSAAHSIRYSQSRAGLRLVAGSYGDDVEVPPRRPLVKVHPDTGRPSLFIGRHAHAVTGHDPQQSEALLDELLAFACRTPRTYQHQWRPGDVAVWDNRCVLHRARPYDYREPRLVKHTRVMGGPSERAEP